MKRTQLLDLLAALAGANPEATVVVTGPQAMHAYTHAQLVEEGEYCELLLTGEAMRFRHPIEDGFGPRSVFAEEHRIHARVIGLVSIELPGAWKERLGPFEPDPRLRNIRALEVHDYAVSMLDDASEDDLAILIDLFRSGLIEPELLNLRAQASENPKPMAHQMQRLIHRLEKVGLAPEARQLKETAAPADAAPPDQLSLFFDASAAENPARKTGLDAWREERNSKLANMASSLGLPIGKRVEVTLRNGVRLKGKLIVCDLKGNSNGKLRADALQLRIDTVDFRASEIESCVREED